MMMSMMMMRRRVMKTGTMRTRLTGMMRIIRMKMTPAILYLYLYVSIKIKIKMVRNI